MENQSFEAIVAWLKSVSLGVFAFFKANPTYLIYLLSALCIYLLWRLYKSKKKYKQLLKGANECYLEYEQLQERVRQEKALARAKWRDKESEEEYKKSFTHKLSMLQDSKLTAKMLMNTHEFKIYMALVLNKEISRHFIVCPQVSLRALIADDNEAWKSYASLIADFVFVLKDFKQQKAKPIAILEYHGGGHYSNNAEETKQRDRLKFEAVKRAGMGYFVIYGKDICSDNLWSIDERKLGVALSKVVKGLKQFY